MAKIAMIEYFLNIDVILCLRFEFKRVLTEFFLENITNSNMQVGFKQIWNIYSISMRMRIRGTVIPP